MQDAPICFLNNKMTWDSSGIHICNNNLLKSNQLIKFVIMTVVETVSLQAKWWKILSDYFHSRHEIYELKN